MGKSQIGIERARVWNWERRTKLLLVAALAYPFLVSLCDLLRALIARSRSPPNKKAKSGDLSRKSERYQASLSTSWPYLPNPKGCRRMKRKTSSILLMLVIAALCFPGITVTAASAATTPVATRAIVTFRLHVSGDIPNEMTFWIAYGPLAGQFGIVLLHRSDTGLYTVSMRLPGGRSTFAYVAGYGVNRVRYGLVPGYPVITIRCLDRSTARQVARRAEYWHVPVG
jgi:hypothetical protein